MFGWLHFSDLHVGLSGQRPLWPNVREAFLDDLSHLCEKAGPWKVVFFTGDLTQQGRKEEFDALEKQVLRPIWQRFEDLGQEPILLAVPGNHDLVRPDAKKPSPALKWLLRPEMFADVADEVFDDADSDYRKVIDTAFLNYRDWWQEYRAGLTGLTVHHGLLPGDFSTTIEAGGKRIGIVGLNTAFLQLAGGDYRGRLAVDLRQFHAACGGDGPAWVNEHDVCVLLTHQGPLWLSKDARAVLFEEINPPARFAVHLFGHEHELETESRALNGGPARNLWQGPSLFSLEKFGEPPQVDRRHGYAAGRLDLDGDRATMRLWPRTVRGLRFIPDHDCVLKDDHGTAPIEIPLRKAKVSSPRKKTADTVDRAKTAKLDAYRLALLRSCDIVNLAGLPEGDRNLAMERFLLRNLYVPLRVRPDVAPADELEARREMQRLREAGRIAEGEEPSAEPKPVGELLQQAAKRLVILGDPGGGKTTMLRWMATAYLLRLAKDEQLAQLPDAATLPEEDWWPILIRCRELEPERLRVCSLDELLRQAVRRLEIPAPQALQEEIADLLQELLIEGRALLLVDGLDEITDPALRGQFCERLDQIAAQYERSPIVVTSRIVGYREMNRRLGRGFQHGILADLSEEDKNEFVRRWCEVTEPPDRRAAAAAGLREAIHSSDRIERLTGNPMLLTTLALVKRKVGKLPTRRHELYREAVDVLLNWRSEIGERLDQDEALPQLQYLAYAMCRDGVQQLRREEVLSFLRDMRGAYPHIGPIHRRSPEEFLRLLEQRTSLLVEMGEQRHNGRLQPVYEFRHLTFQEYLAALALVEGRYPGHDRSSSLAERVAPLAGQVVEDQSGEFLVAENWREALRLCVTCCNDDDVDTALKAIAELRPGEDSSRVTRARVMLAALCLADEPNVRAQLARDLLAQFAAEVEDRDVEYTVVDELSRSIWVDGLRSALAHEFMTREPTQRGLVAWMCGITDRPPDDSREADAWLSDRIEQLRSTSIESATQAALVVWRALQDSDVDPTEALSSALLPLLEQDGAPAHAGAWALYWLAGSSFPVQLGAVIRALETLTDPEALHWLAQYIFVERLPGAEARLRELLHSSYPQTRAAAADALGSVGDAADVPPLIALLGDNDAGVRTSALRGVTELKGDKTDRKLLSRDFKAAYLFLDPNAPIRSQRIPQAAAALELPESEVRQRYEKLADDYGLKLEWRPESGGGPDGPPPPE